MPRLRVNAFSRAVIYAAGAVPLPEAYAILVYWSSMLAIRLPQSIEKRLEKLARRTGRTKTFYVREAILEHLDDLEDLYAAERSLKRIRSGDEQTVPLEDALKRHGLED